MKKKGKTNYFIFVVFFFWLNSSPLLGAQELVPIQDSKDLLAILSKQDMETQKGGQASLEKKGVHATEERNQEALNLPKGGEIDLYQTMVKMISYLSAGLNGKGKLIKVLASQSLGPKKLISLIEVSGSLLVLAVTQQGISLLSRLGPPTPSSRTPLREWMGEVNLSRTHSSADFSHDLQHLVDGPPVTPGPTEIKKEPVALNIKPKKDGWLNSEGHEKGLSSTIKSLQGSLSKFKEGWE